MSGNLQFTNFEKGKELKYWDGNKVLLSSFINKDSGSEIRYFRKKPENFNAILNDGGSLVEIINDKNISDFKKPDGTLLTGFDFHREIGKHLLKIPSRTVLSEIREPFIIEPWNQCLIDNAVIYGSKIDDDKEKYLFGEITGDEMLMETKVSLANIKQTTNWKWASRSQMVCHADSIVYGEIDEIWFDESTNTFYIGDTKTSSSVDKLSYWYQLGVYIEILKSLNPNISNSISPIAKIQWVRFKTEKWKIRPDFDEKDEQGKYKNVAKQYEDSKRILDNMEGKEPETIENANSIVNDIERNIISKYNGRGNESKPGDEYYWMKWSQEKVQLDKIEWNCEIVEKDLESNGVLELVRRDFEFIKKYNVTNVDDFKDLINSNAEAKLENEKLQNTYNRIKTQI